MCFSPVASFTTAAVTGVIGIIALTRVSHWRDAPLAGIPLVFAIQQALEGGLWLILPSAPQSPSAGALTLAFLLIAQVFWPAFMPFAAWSGEPAGRRRDLMLLCLGLGLALAGYLLGHLLGTPHSAEIARGCIVYRTPHGPAYLVGPAYFIAACVPLMLSSRRPLAALGVITAIGFVVAYLLYAWAFLSVWCFFAAAASVVILAHGEAIRRRARPRR